MTIGGVFLPYKSGESDVGDRVKNDGGKKGIVIDVQPGLEKMVDDELAIKWDEGIVEIQNYRAGDYTLVSRTSKVP